MKVADWKTLGFEKQSVQFWRGENGPSGKGPGA